MSILSDAASAPVQWGAEQIISVVMLALVPIAIVLAWWVGIFRRRNIVGPSRVADSEAVTLLLLFMGGTLVTFILAQVFCLAAMIGAGKNAIATTAATTPTTLPSIADLTPMQMAVSTSVPFVVGFAFMVVVNAKFRARGLSELGLSGAQLFPGILKGLVGSAIAVPLTFLAALATEFVWQYLHFSHPAEHELLRVLGEHVSPLVTILLILSATLIAPLAEETLVRGHLQTWLTHGMSRLGQFRTRRPISRGFDVLLPGGEVGHVSLPPAPATYDPPTVLIRWISVLITSVIFGLMHPIWMTPPIFVLAVCLGYAYERTGNLWTTITMHAVFNTTSTILFLFVLR